MAPITQFPAKKPKIPPQLVAVNLTVLDIPLSKIQARTRFSSIPTEAGHCCLVIVLDLFNRVRLGWHVADSRHAKNTWKALIAAVKSGIIVAGFILFLECMGWALTRQALSLRLVVDSITENQSPHTS